MCGFVCYRGFDKLDTYEISKKIIHRGPDSYGSYSNGVFSAGFRRLSILDLSDAADQPFSTKDNPNIIVFNGELYNYKEIKNKLISLGYSFDTSSDTEVVYFSYLEWGERCFEKF